MNGKTEGGKNRMKKNHDFSGDTGTYALPFLQYLDSFLIFLKKKEDREKRTMNGETKRRITKQKKKERKKEEAISFAHLEFEGSVHPLLRNRNECS